MQRFINFLFILSFLFLTNAFAGGDGTFYKGADAIVAQSSLPPFYQPSQRFPLIQSLQNARFFGNQGIWNPEIPVHVQALNPDSAPQSYTDSLLQLLFPSPDGVNLTANQASSDPLQQVEVEKIAQLIKVNSQPQLVESDILNCLFPEAKIDEEIRTSYLDFLRYEFLRQVFQQINEAGDMLFSTFEIDLEDPQKYSKIFDKVLPEYKTKGLIAEGEIEKFALANRMSQLMSLKKPSKKQLQDLEELKTRSPQFFSFETRRSDFLSFRFVDTFLKAKQEPSYLFENPIEKALLGYMWLKFKTPGERGEFYRRMGVDGLTDIFRAEGYTFTDYQQLKTQPLDTLDAEQLALLKYGYDLFENPFPTTVPYGKATLKIANKDVTCPDCVEASLLSLLLYKARQLKEGYYQIVAEVFPECSLLRGFFERYTSAEQFFSQKAHSAFAQILAQLENVKYLKPSGNAEKTYEVNPGFINSLHVFGSLIPELESFLGLGEGSSFQEISEALNTLCAYLFSNDASWTWSGIDEEDNLFENGDIYGTITFSRDQEAVLRWEHDDQHTSLECLAENAKRFSREESEFIGRHLQLQSFLDLRDLAEAAKSGAPLEIHPQVFSTIVASTDYRSARAKIHGMATIFESNLEALKPLGFSLVRSLADADEDDTNQWLARQFVSMVRGHSLSEPDARKILEQNLSLLSTPISIDEGEHPCDFVFNALHEIGHVDWLIEVAPKCHGLSTGNHPEIVKPYLPYFSSLISLGLHLDDLRSLEEILEGSAFGTQNLVMGLHLKAFDPRDPWFNEWLRIQKKKVYILPYSFIGSDPESIINQLAELLSASPTLTIGSGYLKEEDQEIVRRATSLLSAKEQDDEG